MYTKLQRIAKEPQTLYYTFLRKISNKIFNHTKFKKCIVLSRSRTGSNLLVSYLNSHPNISIENEIFQKLNGSSCNEILENVFAKQPLYVRVRGFKIFYYHPLDDETSDIWNILANMDDIHVIHLKRKNILRTLISRKIAEEQNNWALTESDKMDLNQNKSVVFSEEELETLFNQTRSWENNGDAMFSHHPLITVYYEDIVSDLKENMEKIYEFLGLRYLHPSTFLKRQNPESMHELISNYKQLKRAFNGSEWQIFFED